MGKCENCGTSLQNYICSNCEEELYIVEFQGEFLEEMSDEFVQKAAEQMLDAARRQARADLRRANMKKAGSGE